MKNEENAGLSKWSQEMLELCRAEQAAEQEDSDEEYYLELEAELAEEEIDFHKVLCCEARLQYLF